MTTLRLAVGVLVLGGALAGCKSSSGGAAGGHPTYLYVDPAFTPAEPLRIPVVVVTHSTEEPNSPQFLLDHFEDALGAAQAGYTLVSSYSVERDAARHQLGDLYKTLNEQWSGSNSMDPVGLRQLGDALGARYLMAGHVSEWEEVEVDINVEGYSYSEVGCSLKLFDVQTGNAVWDAKDKVRLQSAHYDPSQGAGRKDDLGIVRGQSRVVPKAPPLDTAARQVANNLVASLPPAGGE